MKPLFSTDDLHPRDRFDCWHEAARQMVVDHDSRPKSRLQFEANIEGGVLGELVFVACRMSALEFVHSTKHIDAASPQFLVCMQLAGSFWVQQSQRTLTLQPGEMVLLDPYLPYEGLFSFDSSLLVLKLPRRELICRAGPAGDIVARPIPASSGLPGLTLDFVRSVASHIDTLEPQAASVAVQVLDMLALTLSTTIDTSTPRLSNARLVVLTQVRAIVEQRLGEVDLTPDAVARAAGVSVRYVNAVLAEEGTSISRLIRTRRLERCRRAFADPTQSHRTISDVAYRWGFSDMTHFSRQFRRAFGILPSDYRAVPAKISATDAA